MTKVVPLKYLLLIGSTSSEQYGVNYRMISWGRYLRVVITNNRSDSVRIGGEYKLQRMIDDNFTDIDDDKP